MGQIEMLDGIVRGAIAGAVGGIVGGAVVWSIQRLFGKKAPFSQVIPIACIAAALGISRYINQPTLIGELDKQPAVQVLREHYPTDYDLLKQKAATVDPSKGVAAAQNELRAVLSAVVTRQTPKADAANTRATLELVRDEGFAIKTVSPAACVEMFSTGRMTIPLTDVLSPAQQARDQEVSVALLKQTAISPASPAIPLSDDQAGDLGVAAIGKLATNDQAIVKNILIAGVPPKSPAEEEAMCSFYIGYVEAALSSASANGAEFLRSFAATK